MLKAKRIFFVVFIISFFLLGVIILYKDLWKGDGWERLKRHWDYLIPFIWVILSIPSLFFNLEKLTGNIEKSIFYRANRVGDLLFGISTLLISLFAIISFFLFYSSEAQNGLGLLDISWRFGLIVLVSLVSIFMIFDNVIFHRSFQKLPKDETIDDIGKESQ